MIRLICLSIILYIFVPTFVQGQQCFEYHKQACQPKESRYSYDNTTNSVSFLFKAGEQRRMPLTLYAGKDFRITICGDEVFNNVILFSIIREDGNVLYDNSQYNYALNIEFSSLQTQEAIMLIEIPKVASDELVQGCVGVLVEDMVSIKTGF